MFTLNDDLSIYATRGDIVFFSVSADDDGIPHKFQAGDVVRIKIYGKKDAATVVLQKDFPVTEITESVAIFLTEEDTKIDEVINKPKDYWYEVELNPYTYPQTIIGYDEDGAKVFKLFPEGADIPEYVPEPEEIPVVDDELDLTSTRPVQNQVVARAVASLEDGYERTHAAVANLHITPQMFGAIGDGKADDTEAVQKAIDYYSGKAGDLFFPFGQYRITRPLTIKSNIHLFGATSAKYGRYNSDIPSTVLFYDGNEVVDSFIRYDRNGSYVYGGGISNLSIDGREKVNYLINLSKSGRVTISKNSLTYSLKAAIYSTYAYEDIIKGNWIAYNNGCAILFDQHANANIVRDNAISLSKESSGIVLNQCNGNVISGNTIEGGHGASVGINIKPTALPSQNMITENRIEFESHRFDGETEGICILIGAAGDDLKPRRNIVRNNAVFNQVIPTNGSVTKHNYQKVFVDYGLGTVTDFYDHTVLSKNAKMVVSDGLLENYKDVYGSFSYARDDGGVKISLKNATNNYPIVYQTIDARDLRGEVIALSCLLKCNINAISVGIEFRKNGTGDTWEKLGTSISAVRESPFSTGEYHLMHVEGIVPEDCDTAVISINFGNTGQIPSDNNINIKWCKLTRYATWK